MPFIALLVTPVLACFFGGVVAAAAKPVVAVPHIVDWPDNVIRFDPTRRRA